MEDFDTDSLCSGKKVRFDLNDEVFVIPSKWDRLSRKPRSGKDKLAEGPCTTAKAKPTDVERRAKSKQRSKKVKKNIKSPHNKSSTTRTLSSPSSQTLELETSVLSTEITNRTRSETPKTNGLERKTEIPEAKFKLSHRNNKEVSQDDIVLPRINYNSGLKKAIEHAVVRNRTSSEIGDSKQQNETNDNYSFFARTRSCSDNHSSSSSSTFDGQDNVAYKDECVLVLPERETKFSELSQNVESWSPFLNGQAKERKGKMRGQKMPATLVIPNSILY